MSSKKPEQPPLPVPCPKQMECSYCRQKPITTFHFPFHSCPNGHTICAKCKETGISCPICKAPLEKIKADEGPGALKGQRQNKTGEENYDSDSDGLKGGAEDQKSKKRKHDGADSGSDTVEDSQDDFIESDAQEMVIKVKAGQTIKIINDADNSSMNLTKHPVDVGYSITSTSTSENKTSSASFSFGPDGISNINSSISSVATIQVGEPIVGNSSTATIQITPPAFTFGNMGNNSSPGPGGIQIQTQTTSQPPLLAFGNMGNMGMEMQMDGVPSVYGPGAIVTRNNSTFTANGATINGNNNTITGNGNSINGNNNKINGDNNKVNGSSNQIFGNLNEISGSNNDLKGFNNKATGFNNQ